MTRFSSLSKAKIATRIDSMGNKMFKFFSNKNKKNLKHNVQLIYYIYIYQNIAYENKNQHKNIKTK